MLVKLHILVSMTNERVWRYWRYTGKFSYITNTSILMLIFTVNAMRLKSERRSVYAFPIQYMYWMYRLLYFWRHYVFCPSVFACVRRTRLRKGLRAEA